MDSFAMDFRGIKKHSVYSDVYGFLKNATAKIPLPKSLETAANLAKKVGGEKWANEPQ